MLKYFDLQLFSEEKTEQPTSKKIRDARNKGQVVQSKDLNSAISLLAVFLGFTALSQFYIENLIGFYQYTMNMVEDTASLFTTNGIALYFSEAILMILKLSLPLLLIAMFSGVFVSYSQVGFLFTAEPLKPKLEKINPLKGLKNMFSAKSIVEMLKAIAISTLVLYVAYSYILDHINELLITLELEVGSIVVVMWDLIYNVVIRCAILMFAIGVFDFIYKKRKNKKELMMSKQEIKEEYKQSEGDPQLKAKIKEKQRAFAMGRMMQEVPKADVIITNPTHFAVALKYDTQLGEAPVVVAKGQDLIAQNIKKIGNEHEIPIVENKPLAQTLYKTVQIGAYIPADLYEAVAEVLAYVYSLKNKS